MGRCLIREGAIYHFRKKVADSKVLEVVSKFQIGFKGPAKRDYMSDLNKLRYASRRQADRESAVRLRRMSIYRRLCCTVLL